MTAAYRYYELKKCRICTHCGHRDAMPGRVLCGVCSETNVESAERLKSERRAKGLCHHCGQPPTPGYKTCAAWRERDRMYHRNDWRQKRGLLKSQPDYRRASA